MNFLKLPSTFSSSFSNTSFWWRISELTEFLEDIADIAAEECRQFYTVKRKWCAYSKTELGYFIDPPPQRLIRTRGSDV